LPDIPRGDVDQLAAPVFLGPRQKKLHGMQIGAAGMLIADRAEEKFLRGERGGGAGAMDDGREFLGYA
jgi:hypothetical protein